MDTSRLSNDSRRYSQSSSSSTTATSAITGVKSKWIKAFRSLKLTAVGGGSGSGSRNNDLANLEAQRAYRISVQLGVHAFQEYTYKKITACDVCREILRGHSRQGLKCKLCKINVHGQCQENAPKCQPKPRLLRKQKSASELETKITIPQIDDEKYQNYDPVYQSLRAAADARKCAQLVTEHYSNYNSSSSGGGGSNQQSINHHNYHHHSSTSNINNPNSGSSSGGGGGNHNKHYHYQHQHNNNQDSGSGSGSSGSISIKQNYNNNGGNRQQTHQQQQGSNDSLQTGSQTNLMHGQQHRQDLSCQQQQQPSSLSIKMTHRNSDSEFHQSTIEYHQQQYGSMMIKQQQSDLQRYQQQQQQHYNNISGTSSINNSNEQSPMLTNRTLPSIAYFNTNGGNSNLINKPLSIVHQQQQQHPSLLMIQQQQQAYSAPHSPQKKKLTLRMKSLSLDSPESAETLKEKQRNFSTPPIPPTLQLPPPINHHPHHHSHHYHQQQQQLLRRDMIINIADPLTQQQSNLSSQPSTATTTTTTSSITSTTSSSTTTAATLPPTVGLVGQSPTPPRYDSNELINHYSTFKSAAVVPSATTASTTSSIQPQSQQPPPPPPTSNQQQPQPQTISQPSSLPISLKQQSQTQPSSTVSTPPSSNQYCQMTKRFKLGIHGRMRSFERDDQIFIQDLQCSPCPSPKPQRLLPTNIFVVLYNFRSRQIDELNLRAGYMVTVVDTTDPEWWQGKCMGKVGFFPSKYVTKLFPGERPLQVIHTVQLTDGEFAIKLLREQIVIQVSDEMSGIIMVRTGQNDKIVPCPSKYLQEITF